MSKNKLKLEISPEVKKIFSKAEMGTVVEDFSSQLKLVAENVSGLHDKVDNLEVKVDKIGADLEIVKMDVEVIKMDIEDIKHDLKNKISRDEFAILERRVALLESRR